MRLLAGTFLLTFAVVGAATPVLSAETNTAPAPSTKSSTGKKAPATTKKTPPTTKKTPVPPPADSPASAPFWPPACACSTPCSPAYSSRKPCPRRDAAAWIRGG